VIVEQGETLRCKNAEQAFSLSSNLYIYIGETIHCRSFYCYLNIEGSHNFVIEYIYIALFYKYLRVVRHVCAAHGLYIAFSLRFIRKFTSTFLFYNE
jgi:hypothetical protein